MYGYTPTYTEGKYTESEQLKDNLAEQVYASSYCLAIFSNWSQRASVQRAAIKRSCKAGMRYRHRIHFARRSKHLTTLAYAASKTYASQPEAGECTNEEAYRMGVAAFWEIGAANCR